MKHSTTPTAEFPPMVRQKQETPASLLVDQEREEIHDQTAHLLQTTGSGLGTTSPLTDQQLDRKIIEEFRSKFNNPHPDAIQLLPLFRLIAKHSGNTLEFRPDVLLDRIEDPNIIATIEDAWKTQSLGKLRTMPEIFSRQQPDMRSHSSDIITGFQQDYHGMAVDAFLEYLEENEKNYRKGTYYAKFCSIVQSSGTGKSRLLCELRKKDVIVLYMNIRDPGDVHAYPPQDTSPANILIGDFTNEDNYTHRCHAFFTAIFTCLQERLSQGSEEDFIKKWNNDMALLTSLHCETARAKFFHDVQKEYDSTFAQIVDGTIKDGVKAMGNAFCSLHFMLMKRGKPRGPFLVIAIDEAHELTDAENWRPSVVFCRAIADYSAKCQKCKCWVVFASTTSKVADFASPQIKYASARVPMGRSLFPPFTELGWDQMATPSNKIPTNENAKLKHIRGFGRPLWKSIGNDFWNLKSLARLKLAPGIDEPRQSQSDEDRNHLAVLSQRFGLDIYFDHKEATSLIENAIASRGRICLATTEDRTWSFTTYPSEPFLSCVAANILHTSPDVRSDILMTMMRKVKTGLIEVRKTGELANRLIFLLGKGLYIRQLAPDFSEILLSPNHDSEDESDSKMLESGSQELEFELFDCKMVPLIGYLEYMFGTSFWGGTEAEAKKLFANAYINFSHWVPMKDNIGKRKGISGYQWILRLWQRTSAVQCCHGQPMIDAMIPIYYNCPELPLEERFSLCCISVKLTAGSNLSDLNDIQLEHHSIDYSSDHPWITILVDYGLNTSKVTAKITQNTCQCLRIYAAGITPNTFKFLENQDLSYILQELVMFEGPVPHRKIGAHLRNHMEFGSTANADSMVWETTV